MMISDNVLLFWATLYMSVGTYFLVPVV